MGEPATGHRVWVFHKMKPSYLESMRRMDSNEKVVDIRVQDPDDKVKVYSCFKPGDVLHFADTGGAVLRLYLGKIKAFGTVREALQETGFTNAFPEAASLDEAEQFCLQLGNYRGILGRTNEQKPVYALWFMRYLVYVAGPYTPKKAGPGTPEWEKERRGNIMQAIHHGKDIMQLGYLPIVPHSLFDGWERLPGLNEGAVVMAEKAAVARCECFFRIAPSFGTDNEERLARTLGKDVFTTLDQLKRWTPEE